jgi:archaellum component FlaC
MNYQFDSEEQLSAPDLNRLKSLLLFYTKTEDGSNSVFWKETSYSNIYSANEWKRIVKSKAFRRFYDENCNRTVNLEELLKEKRWLFFNIRVMDYDSPLSRFEKAFIYDALCYICDNKDSIWNYDYVSFEKNTQTSRPTLFADKEELYGIGVTKHKGHHFELPYDWQEILREEYPNVSFINYPAKSESNPDSVANPDSVEEHNVEEQECIDINQFMNSLEKERCERINKETDRVRNKISSIKDEIEGLEDEIEGLEYQIEYVKENINKAENEAYIHSLKDKIDDYEKDITNLRRRLTILNRRNNH